MTDEEFKGWNPIPITHIMVLTPGAWPRLESALAIEGPDAAGMVCITEPIMWDGQSTDRVPATHCYVFDLSLLRTVNALIDRSRDGIAAATHILAERQRPAFALESAIHPPKMH